VPVLYGIARDEADELFELSVKSIEECDVLVITAGSSASIRDLTAEVINRLGKPGVLAHGVNVRPGKADDFSSMQRKTGCWPSRKPGQRPRNSWYFCRTVVHHLVGLTQTVFRPSVPARLTLNLSSQLVERIGSP
jgi:molybdopterin molybdotransferase